MVYKIRNKAFFLTMSGWKNNYHIRVLNDVSVPNVEQTFLLDAHEDAPPMVRYYAQYRNISRKIKQYLYGDKELENIATLWIKEKFQMILYFETPIHLVQPAPERRITAQGDRDYELINNNTHPYQLDFYKTNNEFLKNEMEQIAIREKGEKTLEDQFVEIFSDRVDKLKEVKGDDLSVQDLHKLTEELFTLYTIARGSEKSRTPSGDFKDFLEVKRPFIDPSVNNANAKVD